MFVALDEGLDEAAQVVNALCSFIENPQTRISLLVGLQQLAMRQGWVGHLLVKLGGLT